MKKICGVLSVFLMFNCAFAGELQIEHYVHGRSFAYFRGSTNILYVLTPGTRGLILKRKLFRDGRAAYLIKIEDGVHKGKTAWVYYDEDRHDVRLMDEKQQPTRDTSAARSTDAIRSVAGTSEPEIPAPLPVDPVVQQGQAVPDGSSVLSSDPVVAANSVNAVQQAVQGTLGSTDSNCQAQASTPALPQAAPDPYQKPAEQPPLTIHDCGTNEYSQDGIYQYGVSAPTTASDSDIESDDPEITSLAQSITAGLTSEWDKAMAIHNWVAKNISYDPSTAQAFSDGFSSGNYNLPNPEVDALTVLHAKYGICAGYANLYAALARAAGLKTSIVVGKACVYNPDHPEQSMWWGHAWDEVMVDGKPIQVDTTWDHVFFDPSRPDLHQYQEHYFDFNADPASGTLVDHRMPPATSSDSSDSSSSSSGQGLGSILSNLFHGSN